MNLRLLTTGLGLATLLTVGLSADFAGAQDPRSSVLSRWFIDRKVSSFAPRTNAPFRGAKGD